MFLRWQRPEPLDHQGRQEFESALAPNQAVLSFNLNSDLTQKTEPAILPVIPEDLSIGMAWVEYSMTE